MISAERYLGGMLLFLYRAVRRHLFLMILLPAAAAATAFIVAKQLPPVYSVQANVRTGRIDTAELMSPSSAAARINSATFKQRVLSVMNAPAGDRSAGLISGSLAARADASDMLIVSVRAATGQEARQALDATVQLLNEEQDKIREPLAADINEQLATIDANIANLTKIQNTLTGLTSTVSETQAGDPASAAFRMLWLLDLTSRNEQSLGGAKAERRAVVLRLSSSRTYPTEVVDGAFVQPAQVSPRPAMFAVLAAIAALLACIVYALMRGSKIVGALR